MFLLGERSPGKMVSVGTAAAARRFVSETLGAAWPSGVVDDVRLLVSEVVSNAIVHGGKDGEGRIDLTIEEGSDGVRVEVTDAGDGFDPGSIERGGDDSGFGLSFVDRLSRAWGVTHRDGSFVVWFEVARGT
jgi:anti-sigma regulatory factor (Ser/Thr protein kinase)